MGYYCLGNTLGHFVVLIPQSLLIDKPENINWESYARGAVYALQNSGYDLRKVTHHIYLLNSADCVVLKNFWQMISCRVS